MHRVYEQVDWVLFELRRCIIIPSILFFLKIFQATLHYVFSVVIVGSSISISSYSFVALSLTSFHEPRSPLLCWSKIHSNKFSSILSKVICLPLPSNIFLFPLERFLSCSRLLFPLPVTNTVSINFVFL